MAYNWEIFLQEEVQKQRKIPIPTDVKTTVGFNNELHGPCVHINYERNASYIVLSRYPLREPNYQDVGRYKIHGVENIDEQGGRIRLPDSLDDMVKSYYYEGERVIYMAYQQMLDDENPTVFLLSNTKVIQLLPPEAQGPAAEESETEDLQQSLMDLPSFLPPK